MDYEQFVSKLEKAGIEHTLFHFDTAVYVEIGRYGFRFEQGQFSGGWIRDCGDDWRSEGRAWLAMWRGPI